MVWAADLYARGILGIAEDDVCFSVAKLYFAYGLSNALYFPLRVGAGTVLHAGRFEPRTYFDLIRRLEQARSDEAGVRGRVVP
jgi:benzoate-CoA ligase